MRKYLITILNPVTGFYINYKTNEDRFIDHINSHLGGWNNTNSTISTSKVDTINYQRCGYTKDGSKFFSIICYKGENEDSIKAE